MLRRHPGGEADLTTRQAQRSSLSPEVVRLDRRIHDPVRGEWTTFSETADDSRGRRSVIVVEMPAGAQCLPHEHHAFDERIEVLSGEVIATVAGETRMLRRGQATVIPARVVHAVRNSRDRRAEVRIDVTPGHVGFERAIRITCGLAAEGRLDGEGVPRNPLHRAVLAMMAETFHTGRERPLPTRLLRSLARMLGVERRLLRRHCGLDA